MLKHRCLTHGFLTADNIEVDAVDKMKWLCRYCGRPVVGFPVVDSDNELLTVGEGFGDLVLQKVES